MNGFKLGLGGWAALLIMAVVLLFIVDLLFSKPGHLQGKVIEKIYVPPQTVGLGSPYGGWRGSYGISAQKEEQWIAAVLMENGDTVTVHCHPDHYKLKETGDLIHFKAYKGSHLHIKYLAHNEQED